MIRRPDEVTVAPIATYGASDDAFDEASPRYASRVRWLLQSVRNWGADADVWCATPELVQALLHHPSVDCSHPLFEYLPWSSQRLLAFQRDQSESWYHKPYFRDDVRQRRISFLNGFHQADRLASCMMTKITISRTGRTKWKPCRLPRFCGYCAYIRGQQTLKRYAYGWVPDAWHHLTFSLSEQIPLVPGYEQVLVHILDAMRIIIREIMRTCCTGMFGFEELSVKSFFPGVIIGPHVHTVFHSERGLDESEVRKVVTQLWRPLNRELSPWFHFPEPDIQLAGNLNSPHFLSCCRYEKAMDFETPYNSGYFAAEASDQLERLHQNVQELFQGYELAFSVARLRRKKRGGQKYWMEAIRNASFCGGDCHGASKRCVATPRSIRGTNDHQQRVRALCEQEWADDTTKAILDETDPSE